MSFDIVHPTPTTSPNTANNDTRSFDMTVLKLSSRNSSARSTVLLTKNLSFDSSQIWCMFLPNVTRHAADQEDLLR